jgi:hypothetical protein
MIRFKHGVDIRGIQPETLLALQVAHGFYQELGYDVVITSALDGDHKQGSLHYSGHAIDLRTRNLRPLDAQLLWHSIREALGSSYDVVLEETHLHIEFDP